MTEVERIRLAGELKSVVAHMEIALSDLKKLEDDDTYDAIRISLMHYHVKHARADLELAHALLPPDGCTCGQEAPPRPVAPS